jgi:RimJ/RimL family protein N-acetyltransferase
MAHSVDGAGLVELSPLDEANFGIRTAKGSLESADAARAAIAWCGAENVRLLIARSPTSASPAIHVLEDAGGLLMDVLTHWVLDFEGMTLPPDPPGVTCREATAADEPLLVAAATETFHDYKGHYHADPRLDRAACDNVYVSWIRRSLAPTSVVDNVLLFFDGDVLLSFVTMRVTAGGEGEIVLGGVMPTARGRAFWRPTVNGLLRWCQSRGVVRVRASTQITNVASQRIWARMGFQIQGSEATLHVRLDR